MWHFDLSSDTNYVGNVWTGGECLKKQFLKVPITYSKGVNNITYVFYEYNIQIK